MNESSQAVDFENRLVSLLQELSDIQDEMLAVLAEKRALIASGDVQAMNQLQQREQRLASRLQQCHRQRSDLLQSASEQGMEADNLCHLSQQLAKSGESALENKVKQTSARMRLLQHESLSNWVLAQRSLLHIGQLLEIIATGGQIQPTYGNGQSAHGRGALVDQEV